MQDKLEALPAFRGVVPCAMLLLAFALSAPGLAQERKLGPSPLDTLMNTKLWADVPEAKDFVRQSRPPEASLDYQPVTGADPDRPKLRTADELKTLQSELEQAAGHNLKRAGKISRAKNAAKANP